MRQIPLLLKENQSVSNKLKTTRYIARLHLQYCSILSQLGQHEEALEHAKYGVKYTHIAIKQLKDIIKPYTMKTNTAIIERTAKELLPIIKMLNSKLLNEKEKPKKHTVDFDIRTLFGFTGGEVLNKVNIGSIMQLTPLDVIDLFMKCNDLYELTRESILEKITLLVVSYFCVSTEKRFLSQKIKNKHTDFEFFHSHALKIACTFLPGECPLVSHVYMTYQKHYSILQQPIVLYKLIISLKIL